MNRKPYPAIETLMGFLAGFAIICAVVVFATTTAQAQQISNTVAVFSALDKVTARIRTLEVPIDATVRFGSLKVTPKVCYSRPPEVRPKTTSFVQVDEVQLDGSEKRIFSGWMFAESPALNAVEHPVYDVWLTQCVKPDQLAKDGTAIQDRNPSQSELLGSKRRRLRR